MGVPVNGDKDLCAKGNRQGQQHPTLPTDGTVNPSPGPKPGAIHAPMLREKRAGD